MVVKFGEQIFQSQILIIHNIVFRLQSDGFRHMNGCEQKQMRRKRGNEEKGRERGRERETEREGGREREREREREKDREREKRRTASFEGCLSCIVSGFLSLAQFLHIFLVLLLKLVLPHCSREQERL